MSDTPVMPSGYGYITQYVCAGLTDCGHHVSILGRQMPSQPVPFYHRVLFYHVSSANELLDYLRQLQPDVLVIAADVWWLAYFNHPVITEFLHTANIPQILYYPIDGDTGEKHLPPSWVRILKSVDLPIAINRYSRDVTQANGVEPAHIPLGIDTKVFQPPADKDLAKQALGYEGKFVVLSDARNQLHSLLPRTLEIFQRFAADKDDVILHLHCDPDDPIARSPEYYYDLRSDIAFLNLTEKVCLTKNMPILTGPPLEQLAHIYQAADVHLSISWGEGFGLSTLQAAAAGVAPLASDYTASQEFVKNHGEAIHVRQCLLDQFGLRRALVDIDDAVSKLEKLYRDRQLLTRKAQRAREFALSYDWGRILSQWEELLQREVACRRTSLHFSTNVSGIPDDAHTEEGMSNFARSEHKAGELEAKLRQDMQPERILRIPVTLPLAKSKQRIPGYVYAASQCDVLGVLALQRIFPGLKVWSTVQLDFGSSLSNGKPLEVKVVQAKSPEYRPNLALSTLALDMDNFDPQLPVEAAKLGVPCIGLAQQQEQVWLWPNLSLAKPDPLMAAELGRQMLTDQGVATDVCLTARQRLAGILTPSNDRNLGMAQR